PLLAATGDRGVNLRSDQGRKLRCTTVPRIRDRKAVALQEVVGDAHEVIAALGIAPAHFFRRQLSIRTSGVSVKIPSVEAARCSERSEGHGEMPNLSGPMRGL